MTVIELKEKLISEINSTENEGLLEEILLIIDFEKDTRDIHIMSEAEVEAVEDGLAQLERGEWITNEEANRRADQWLKK